MQTGTLVYLPDRNRMDVCFPDGGSYGGLRRLAFISIDSGFPLGLSMVKSGT